jgi:hypothetical protein
MAEPSTTTPVAAAAPERARLLATKLHRPRPRAGFLARPRLWGRLDQGTAGALTLVGAPAGFGKTSLLGDWARRSRRPVAWLSLDEGDGDPARFWRYVAAALDGLRPGVAQRVEALFQGGQPPPEAVLAVLVNELAAAPEEVVLVLDDYHLVEAPPVHQSAGTAPASRRSRPSRPAAAAGTPARTHTGPHRRHRQRAAVPDGPAPTARRCRHPCRSDTRRPRAARDLQAQAANDSRP